jgi:hypothetical protein
MTLIEALKTDKIDRITSEDGQRWMFWADDTSFWETDHWVVLERVGITKTRTLIVTQDEEQAVAYLVGEEQ